jgi:hypothetical protein
MTQIQTVMASAVPVTAMLGRVNPNQTLQHQGLIGLGQVYYNYAEPALLEIGRAHV